MKLLIVQHCTASNDRVSNEQWIEKDMEGSDYDTV
jgi:hypothetical protein